MQLAEARPTDLVPLRRQLRSTLSNNCCHHSLCQYGSRFRERLWTRRDVVGKGGRRLLPTLKVTRETAQTFMDRFRVCHRRLIVCRVLDREDATEACRNRWLSTYVTLSIRTSLANIVKCNQAQLNKYGSSMKRSFNVLLRSQKLRGTLSYQVCSFVFLNSTNYH